MCYNCACHNIDDDMGDSDNITNQTFERAAKAWGQSVKEAKLNTYKMLRLELRRDLPAEDHGHDHPDETKET